MKQEKAESENKYGTLSWMLPLLLIALDYAAFVSAEGLSIFLRDFLLSERHAMRISVLNRYFVWPFLYLLCFHMNGLYTYNKQFWRTVQIIFKTISYAILALVVLMYMSNIAGTTSRLFLVFLYVFSIFLTTLFRWVFSRKAKKLMFIAKPLLLVGAGKTAAILLRDKADNMRNGYFIAGYLEDGKPSPKVAKQLPHLGGFADAERVIAEKKIKDVVIAAPGMDKESLGKLIYRLQLLVDNISFIPEWGSTPFATMELECIADGQLLLLKVKNNLSRWYNKATKFIFDYTLTIIGIFCIAPLLIFIALWIYYDSPGPVIYKHTRVGKGGKLFACYKFRSMCVDSEEKLKKILEQDPEAGAQWERYFKLKNDPRITRSGAFLRKTSLDELPQIFNVLKGEMSLVGPRPVVPEEIKKYYGIYKEDYCAVRPGITGLWQTSGRSDVSYEERVHMDSWYVRNWSLWFDIVLLWRTFGVVLGKKGAY